MISQLIIETLTRSPHIAAEQVSTTLAALAPAGMMLTAAGHLERTRLVLVVADLYLTIGTISGDGAFSVDENLNPVPGAAEARDWTLHMPTPAPHTDALTSMLSTLAHVSTDPAPKAATASLAAPVGESALNLQALAERGRNR